MSPNAVERIIFACVRSAGRSQIAVAWFNMFANPAKAHAEAAGTRPAAAVHPEVVAAMREEGINLAAKTPQLVTPALIKGVRLVVTMGCAEQCPVVPGVERVDWPVEDPKGKPPEVVRRISEEIREKVEGLIAARGWR